MTVRLADLSRRTRLAIATLVAVGTASPLVLFSAPGAPGSPSFLKMAQAPQLEAPDRPDPRPTVATTTTTPPSAPATTTVPPARSTAATAPPTFKAPKAPTRPGAVTNTTAALPPPSTVPAPPGPPRPCTTADISITVTTDRPSYVPGDTVAITVTATNLSADSCTLHDPPQTPPDGRTCQPQVTVYAPVDPNNPTISITEAVVNPACSTSSTHALRPGLAWPVTVSVPIPTSSPQWQLGTHRVNVYWAGAPVWKSGDATFSLSASPSPATSAPAAKP